MTESGWRTRTRWLIVHSQRPGRLLATGPAASLPETEQPGEVWTGETEELTAALAEQAGLDVIVLFCVDEHDDRDSRIHRLTIVATPRPGVALPTNVRWVDAAEDAGVVAAEYDARPPWAGPGWFAGAEAWLLAALVPVGYSITGPVRQVRLWDLSCVLRAPTDRGAVYLKAAVESPLFSNEATVMPVLSELFPAWVPAPLAVNADRRWIVLADLGDQLATDETHWSAPVEVREAVITTAGALQRESVRYLDTLRSAGCVDRGPDLLAAEAVAWLPTLGTGAPPTGVDPATWLSDGEVAELSAAGPRLAAACADLAEYAVPVSLVHGDLLLSNVATGRDGYLFFDWTDACIAHPFVDMLDIHQEEDDAVRDRLRDIYLREWTAFEPQERLLRAWRLAEPLAALHHAISYRSLVAQMHPPIEAHMSESTVYWLRKVIAGLRRLAA